MANVEAAAKVLLDSGRDVILVCSGTNARFAYDDAICAGAVVTAMKNRSEVALTETAEQALRLFEDNRHDIAAAFFETEAGRALMGVGLGADVEFCAAPPKLDIVPKLDRQRMTLLP